MRKTKTSLKFKCTDLRISIIIPFTVKTTCTSRRQSNISTVFLLRPYIYQLRERESITKSKHVLVWKPSLQICAHLGAFSRPDWWAWLTAVIPTLYLYIYTCYRNEPYTVQTGRRKALCRAIAKAAQAINNLFPVSHFDFLCWWSHKFASYPVHPIWFTKASWSFASSPWRKKNLEVNHDSK